MTTTERAFGLAGAALAVALLCTAPAAATSGTPLPEVGDGAPGTRFVDDPTIVGSHPLPPDSFSRGADPRTVLLHFSSGLPHCYGVHADVTESPTAVTVDLRGGSVPAAVGRMCAMIIVPGTVEVPLADDLGDRQVLAV